MLRQIYSSLLTFLDQPAAGLPTLVRRPCKEIRCCGSANYRPILVTSARATYLLYHTQAPPERTSFLWLPVESFVMIYLHDADETGCTPCLLDFCVPSLQQLNLV